MEESLDFSHLTIPVESLITILSDFHFFAKIRYNKSSNFYDTTSKHNGSNNNNNNKHNIFDFFRKNLDENKCNLFKKEKNFFHVENNPNCEFHSDHFYYTSNESISLIEINKRQNEFYDFFDNFFNNFKNKITEMIKDETLYYNHDLVQDPNKTKAWKANETINNNFMKIINNNMFVNCNKKGNKSSNRITTDKFFMFLECEDNKNYSENVNNTNDSYNDKRKNFSEFIFYLKSNKSCLDTISKNIDFSKTESLNNIFIVIKSEHNFKKFFTEFTKENDSMTSESPSFNYNLGTIKTNEHKNNFLKILWNNLNLNNVNKKFEFNCDWKLKGNKTKENKDYKINKAEDVLFNKLNLKQKLLKIYKDKFSSLSNCPNGLKQNMLDLLYQQSFNYLITLETEEQIYLGFYNIAKRNYPFLSKTTFHLHKAIIENNIKRINDICKNESDGSLFSPINEIDHMGNSPLHLAIKLNRLDAIKVLCDNNAEIKHFAYDDAITPYDYAIINKNVSVLKILVNAIKKQKLTYWHENQKELAEVIKNIPDFSMVFTVSLNSTIFSVIKSITPKDVFKISKKDSNIRIDMNISSLNTALRAFKGKHSLIIQENCNNITITKLDYQKKISYDYIDSITEIKDDENKVEELIAEGWKTKKLNNISLKMHSQSNKKKEEKILGYESQNIIAKGFIYWMKRKLNKKKIEELCVKDKKNYAIYKSFEDYSAALSCTDKDYSEYYFDLEFNFYRDKYLRVLDAIQMQIEQNKVIVCSNKNFNKETNFNSNNNDNCGISNSEINNKHLNPLLFSFGNIENKHKNFPDLLNPTKHSYNHLMQSNTTGKDIENNNALINENEIALIYMMRMYSNNSNIRISFEKDLIEKGFVNEHNSTQFSEIQIKESKNKNSENLQDHKSSEKSTSFSNQYSLPNKFFKSNSNLSNNFINKCTINSTKNLSNKTAANSSTLTIDKLTNYLDHKKHINQNKDNIINNKQYESINKILKKGKEKEENLIEKKISQKEISLSLLTSKDFPIKIFHFIPLIHILSFTSSEFTQLNSFLCSDFLPFDAFPLKIDFPLGLSLNASLAITEFKSDIIQDISISDFQNEDINNNKNFRSNNRNNTNNNNNYFKDLSSNANHSTALLDDKYAKEFYDKYFQEKNVGAFSEFSEESYNKDNFLRGSKSNYSELFRDEEFPAEDQICINYTDNNNIVCGKAAKKTSINQAEFILTELRNEIENEQNQEKMIFKNKIEKNKKSNKKLVITNIRSNNSDNHYDCFQAEVARERESSRGDVKHTETSVPNRHHSIATNQYKNKKIGLNTIILNKNSDKNLSSAYNNNDHNLNLKQNSKYFLNKHAPNNENTIEFYKASILSNKQNILTAKKIIKKKPDSKENIENKENREAKSKTINKNLEINKNNNTTSKTILQPEEKNSNEESLLSACNISVSDFEKTLEENTTLNISKYTQNFKYNKPPEFKQRIKNYLKVADLSSKMNLIFNNKDLNNNQLGVQLKAEKPFLSQIKNENEALKIIDNNPLRNMDSKKLNALSRNEPNFTYFNLGNERNLFDLQSKFTYNSATCNRSGNNNGNITNNRDNQIYSEEKIILKTANQDVVNTLNNDNYYNNTLNNFDLDFPKKFNMNKAFLSQDDKSKYNYNPNNDNKSIDNLNLNNTRNNNRSNNANNSIYIPAAEFNNYYIPTYSNADMNDLDKFSVLDNTMTNNYKINKTEKNLNMQNFILGDNYDPNKNIATETNLDYSAQSRSFNKDFIVKNSYKINFNNSNMINTNEFHYNNANTENLNFDTISLCVRNENNSENCKYNPQNNITINSRIEKINKKVFNQPGKMMRKVSENKHNTQFKSFNTIDFIENRDKQMNIGLDSKRESAGYYNNNSECNNNNLNFDYESDENNNNNNNYFFQQEENSPLEKTVFNKINNMKILPIKFLSRNVNSKIRFNSIQAKGLNDRKENLVVKKKNAIPKYVSNREK